MQHSIPISSFFETLIDDCSQFSSTLYKKKFATYIDNKEFPETIEDKSVIRTLGRKHNLIFDENTNDQFIEYYFKSWHCKSKNASDETSRKKYHDLS